MLTIRRWLLAAMPVALGMLAATLAMPAAAANDPAKVIGPSACSECHTTANLVWQSTHHFASFRQMPAKPEATDIAQKMGIDKIKTDPLCATCHFTVKMKGDKPDPVAGVSCESCHGAAADWNKIHSDFSGKKKDTESADEKAKRWKDSVAAGMIRPSDTYALAKNCYSCHVVPQEKLVNVGGHQAGSPFELVAWTQGEIRHNNYYNEGKGNPEAPVEERRRMLVVGAAVELEVSLRAVGKATTQDKYALEMAKRAQAAEQRLGAIATALKMPELDDMVKTVAVDHHLKLNNDAQLSGMADKIGADAQAFAEKHDGKDLAAVDPMLPTPDKYKGEPQK